MNTASSGPGSSPSGYQELRDFFKERNKNDDFAAVFNSFCQTTPFGQDLETIQRNFIRFLDDVWHKSGHNFQAAVRSMGRQTSMKKLSTFLSTYLAYRKSLHPQVEKIQETQNQLIENLHTETNNQPGYIRLLKTGKAVLDLTADEQKLFEKICKKHKGKKVVVDLFYKCYLEYKDTKEPDFSDAQDLYRPRISAHEEVIHKYLYPFRSKDSGIKHDIIGLFYRIEESFRKNIN